MSREYMSLTCQKLRADMRKFLRELNADKRAGWIKLSTYRLQETADYLRLALEHTRFGNAFCARNAFLNAKGVATEKCFQ